MLLCANLFTKQLFALYSVAVAPLLDNENQMTRFMLHPYTSAPYKLCLLTAGDTFVKAHTHCRYLQMHRLALSNLSLNDLSNARQRVRLVHQLLDIN